jgi:hypothetical protein
MHGPAEAGTFQGSCGTSCHLPVGYPPQGRVARLTRPWSGVRERNRGGQKPGNVQGIFRVEVTQSPAGEARRGQLQQAVLASAMASRGVLTETERPVREVGLALFSALLGSNEVAGRSRASAALLKIF